MELASVASRDATDFFACWGYTGLREVVAAKVYWDLVVILNFGVDFLLLLGTDQLAGFPVSARRAAAAAGVGSAYAGACLVPGFRFLAGTLWRGVCLVAMSAIAFGWQGSAWKRGSIFLLLSLALGGMAMKLPTGSIPAAAIGALGIWGLCRVAREMGAQTFENLTITQGGRQVHLTALRDTGNRLRDPITGAPVVVISPEAAGQLTGLTPGQLAEPIQTMAARPIPGLRLIPYRAVGGSGMLLAMAVDEVRLGRRRRCAIVAFAPGKLGEGNLYQALTGGSL